jgi:hypothetical protein
VLEQQLADEARTLAGIDLRSGGFTLMVEWEEPLKVERLAAGEQLVRVGLLGSDMEHEVGIGWGCKKHPIERVSPANPPSPDCELCFRWIDLPAEHLRAILSGPVPPLQSVGGPYPFFVETWFLAGKDLYLELERTTPWDEAAVAALRARMYSPAFAPHVHLKYLSPRRLQMPTDLGEHDGWLCPVLERLAASELGLTKVIVRSFDAAPDW